MRLSLIEKSLLLKNQLLTIIMLIMLMFLLTSAAGQGIYHNQRVFVVPTPGKVNIDGGLKDWDLSGEILTYVVEASMEYQSAKTAFMYDNDALYISSRVKDPSPMLNLADPAVNPDFGWDGDAFQLRLSLDPGLGYPLKIGGYDRNPSDMLVHMTLWNYSEKNKPVLHLKYGMNYHDSYGYHKGIVPDDKFKAVYKKWDDGKGFTFEYRIPWTTLGAPRPFKGGDLSAAAIQIQWSDATGAHSYGGGWAVDLMSKAGFTYQSTGSWGKVIFAEKGNLPKELTQEGLPPVRQLPLKFNFDLAKENITSITLINSKGDRVRNIIAAESRPMGKVIESWDGLDDVGRVLPPGDYTWKGVTHDPLKTKLVLGVSNAGTPTYNTPDGKGAWGGDWGCPSDVCFAGERGLLIWDGSEAGTGLIGINAKGEKQWGYRVGGSYIATDGDLVYAYLNHEKQIRAYSVIDGKQTNFLRGDLWAENNGEEVTPLKRGEKPLEKPITTPATYCTGMAWIKGKLYVADSSKDTIFIYDAKQGKILSKFTAIKITWLTPAGSDLIAISNGKIVKITGLNDKPEVVPFATEHIDTPQAVTVGTDGTVYASNTGKLQNISVFDKDGKYLRSIGKTGGRAMNTPSQTAGNVSIARAGKWDPDTFLNARGMAIDSKGKLWVTEHDFSPKRISIWEPATGKLLDDKFGPAYVSTPITMDPNDPTRVYCQNVEWEIDLDKKTSKPVAIMFEAKPDTPYFWPHMVNNIVFTAKNGKQYMHSGASHGGNPVRGDYLWIRRGDHFEACAGVINPSSYFSWRQGAKDWNEMQKVPWLFWEDINGDGVIQKDETRETKMKSQGAHSTIDADLNFYATSMYTVLYWQRLSPKTIREDGVPIYDDASFVQYNYGDNGGGNYTSDFTVNPADGSVLFYAGTDIKLLDKTELWPISYWSKDGKVQWRYRVGCRWYDMYEFPIPKPGVLYGCTKNMGITDGITGYSCYFGMAQLITTDGVPIGTIMKDGRSGETGPDSIQCEWFTGQLVKIKDGRWFIMGGDQDGRILEVIGLNSLKRFDGNLTITEEESKAAAKALADWSSQKAKSQSLVLARTIAKPEWLDIRGVTLNVDEKRGFTVKTAYSATDLQVRYEVKSPSPFVNSTPEANMPFKGGNMMDIQIATDPNADPKRKTPAPGDIRILVSRHGEKAFAVIYRTKVAGFTGTPTIFTSPTGTESIDQIEILDTVKMEYEKVDGGFNAVVYLPLDKLGLTPKPGTTQRMDVGYIFGNETGNTTATRVYWTNHSFSSGVTQDIPNEARLEPAQWGNATVE
jgi:hypothetical protein